MGVALLLLFLQIFNQIGLGTTAQAIGQITFSLSYVVVMVRGPAGLDRAGVRGGRGRPRRAARRTCSTACCCRCSRRRSWPARPSSSRSRSTTSSSRSTSPATRARRRCRCCSTPRPAGRRRRRSTRSRRSRSRSRWGRSRSCSSSTGASPAARAPTRRRRRPGGLADAGRNPARGARQVVRPTSSPSTASTCTCRRASSSRWSARPAAARRRRCA